MVIIITITACIIYLWIARKYNIVDLPNERSSHQDITYRGIGIIIPIVLGVTNLLFPFCSEFFILGLLIAGIAGFFDDLFQLRNAYRLVLYIIAIALCMYGIAPEIAFYNLGITVVLLLLITGVVNAFNFMDGINGMTLLYTLVCTVSVMTSERLFNLDLLPQGFYTTIFIVILAIMTLNMRTKAVAFLGDSGSIVLGIICSFMVLRLIWSHGQLGYLGFVLVYGVDSVGTIIYRMLLKQNIFNAHRLHLYQMLTNEKRHNPLKISLVYGGLQVAINISMIYLLYYWGDVAFTIGFFSWVVILIAVYIVLRTYYIKDITKLWGVS